MKPIFIGLGFLFTGVGFVGIFVPGIPTTFPLLLAVFFFGKSSKKFQNWLINHKLLGRYVKDLTEKKGLTRKSKHRAILAMALFIGISILIIPVVWVKILVAALGLVGALYILFILRTLAPVEKKSPEALQ